MTNHIQTLFMRVHSPPEALQAPSLIQPLVIFVYLDHKDGRFVPNP
jgi:hypothetical protein